MEEANICEYQPNGRKKCTKPVATSRPQEAHATLNPNRCAAHQPCKSGACHRTVGNGKCYQTSGLCQGCYGVQRQVKKQEETKQTIQNIVHNKKVPPRAVAAASILAAAYKDPKNPATPPTALRNIDEEITTGAVLENQLHTFASIPGAEIKSDNDKNDLSLEGLKVFVINGDKEKKPGTLRVVTEDGKAGHCTLDGGKKRATDGDSKPPPKKSKNKNHETKIQCGLFAIFRDAKGKAFEEKYLASKSTRNLLFVDSFKDVDFEEETEKVNVNKVVDHYVLGSDGVVKIQGKAEYFQMNLGQHPASVSKTVHGKAARWFEEEYDDWAQERVKKGGEVTREAIEEEFELRGWRLVFHNPTIEEIADDNEKFRGRFPRQNGEEFDAGSHELPHISDDTHYPTTNIDAIRSLESDEQPPMFHATYHVVRGGADNRFVHADADSPWSKEHLNSNYRFNLDEFLAKNNLSDLVKLQGGKVKAIGYGSKDGPLKEAVMAYLNECQSKPPCLTGSVYLADKVLDSTNPDNAEGPPLAYSPHVTPAKADNRRAYISASLTKCLRRFRTKRGWGQHYGWRRKYGDKATVCIIDRKFWPLIERVGCTGVGQNDLGSCVLPLQISTIYEVTWKSVNLHDSTWRKIRENGKWIAKEDQVELTYDQVIATAAN